MWLQKGKFEHFLLEFLTKNLKWENIGNSIKNRRKRCKLSKIHENNDYFCTKISFLLPFQTYKYIKRPLPICAPHPIYIYRVGSMKYTQPIPTYPMSRVPDNDTTCQWYIQQKCCKYTLNKTGFNPSRRSPWSLKLKIDHHKSMVTISNRDIICVYICKGKSCG